MAVAGRSDLLCCRQAGMSRQQCKDWAGEQTPSDAIEGQNALGVENVQLIPPEDMPTASRF
jgi:hypothetical protein